MSSEAMQVNEAAPRYLTQTEAQDVSPGYKRTEAGVIPEDWDSVRLGDVIDLLTGFPFPSSGYTHSGVLLVRGSNVKRGRLDWGDDITKYWPVITANIAQYVLREGDLVIAMDGALVGRSYAVITDADLPSLLLQRVARIRSSKVNQALLACWVASDSFVNHVDSVKTHTAIPHISPSDIRNFQITVPSNPNEQRAIAEALADVDGLLAALDKLIAKKRAIKQAAMQQLLTGKTRLPGFSGEWATKRLGEIATIAMGRTPSRTNAAFWGRGHVWLSIADLQGKIISESKEQITDLAAASMTPIPKGTLLMSFKLSIGRLCFAGCDLFTNEAICSFTNLKANPEYIYYSLGRTDFSLYGKHAVKGYTLNSESLKAIEVLLPESKEQTAIATILSDMDAEIAALEARRDKTRAIKQGMMQQLLTGRIRLVKP